MKTTNATIHFKLRTAKKLSDGTSPVMLVIQWNGRKEQSTGTSCTIEQWDAKNECFKKKMPNYVQLNKLLYNIKNEVIQKKIFYEQNKIAYTAQMLLEKEEKQEYPQEISSIIENMIKDKKLGIKRSYSLNIIKNKLYNYVNRDKIILSELTDDFIISFMQSLENNSMNTVFSYSATLLSIVQYAYDLEMINTFPKKAKQYFKKHYKRNTNHKALEEKNIDKIKWYWLKLYNDGEDMFSLKKKGFALTFYILSYAMFGLAPIDLLKLRQNQISLVEVNNSTYYKIETHRSKTNNNVRIFVDANIYGDLISPFLTNNRTYFLPIFYDGITDEEIFRLTNNINIILNKRLKYYAELLDMPVFTLYSARHSFASISLKNGANLSLIAQGMGRSVNGIATYVKNLNTDEDLISLT